MIIESTRFGKLEVAEEQIICFSHGIPGFPEEKTFAYIMYEAESPFSFLQSATEANLTFLIVDPFAFFHDYEFIIDDEIANELGLSQENPPQVFLIAKVKGELADMTVNLLAPIIINRINRTGRQVILDRPEYSISYKLFPYGLPEKAGKGGK
jgi:flagellar assembly factor FliW